MMSSDGKLAIISCEDAPKWGGPEGARRLCKMFKNQPDETWEYFMATEGEIPDSSKLEEYKGFVLTGSHYSANDQHDWILRLEKFLKDVFEYQEAKKQCSPKLVGICFGHQIMAKSLGAKVVKNNNGKFVFELGQIDVDQGFKEKEYYQKVFKEDPSFSMFQSHSEEVKDLPSDVIQSVARSDKCEHEILTYNKEGGLSFQGHMEITSEECLEKILPAIKNAGVYSTDQESEMKETLKKRENQREQVVTLIKEYLEE